MAAIAVIAASPGVSSAEDISKLRLSLDLKKTLRTDKKLDVESVKCDGALEVEVGARQHCLGTLGSGVQFAIDVVITEVTKRTVEYEYSYDQPAGS